MQSRTSRLFFQIVALAIVGVTLYILAKAATEEPSVVAALVTAAATGGALIYQRNLENKREVSRLHRDQLAPRYDALFGKLTSGADLSKGRNQAFISDFQRKLILYASPEVVAAWVTFVRFSESYVEEGEGDPSVMLAWEKVLQAIRLDLGLKNDGLEAGDLLRIYIADSDSYIREWYESQRVLSEGEVESGQST